MLKRRRHAPTRRRRLQLPGNKARVRPQTECAAFGKESNVELKGLLRKLAPNEKLPRPQPRRLSTGCQLPA